VSTTSIKTPSSLVRFGFARADITPPVGIYHRMWGAARHDVASGVHRPVLVDVLVLAPRDPQDDRRMVRALFDFVGLAGSQQERMAQALAEAAGVPRESVVITHSHSHASGMFAPNRQSLPGGNKVVPYLNKVRVRLADACRQACDNLKEATVSYARARCDLAANRDYHDDGSGGRACGYNPDAPADDTVWVGRVTDASGAHRATLVNYACHPTTLAWENTLLSPDYVGAMREVVESETGSPCTFFQGPCGDLGPRDGFVGDTAIADRNGRQLGHAALSALNTLGPPETDFAYRGVVVSGATLGTWGPRPFAPSRADAVSRFDGGALTVDLPLKDLPDPASLRRDMQRLTEEQKDADDAGDAVRARDLGARAERCRRWLGRLEFLPEGPDFTFHYSVYRFGDAVWVTCGGEPYNLLQTELRARFPEVTILVSPVAGDSHIAYLLPRDRYGQGLYQEEPSSLGPGALETLIDAIADRIADLTSE